MSKNVMIVGVGGQGTLLTSRIIGKAALCEGYDVKISEQTLQHYHHVEPYRVLQKV